MGRVPQDGPGARQLGEFLRAARQRRGLTLRQVASITKIPRRHLEALEHGDLSVVTEDFYRRIEVRTFASTVGLDPKAAVARLDELLSNGQPEEPRVTFAPSEPPLGERMQLLPLALLAMMTAAVVVPWTRGSGVPTRALAVRERPARLQAAIVLPVPAPALAAAETAAASPDSPAPAVDSDLEEDTPVVAVARRVLVITSDPPGSRVVVDGIGRGITPVEIPYLSPGEKHVRIIRDGFLSQERTIRLSATQPTELHVELSPSR
jgi:transcriptional regulator with XRE-family HTH domain